MCNHNFYRMPLTCPYIFKTLCDKIFITQIKKRLWSTYLCCWEDGIKMHSRKKDKTSLANSNYSFLCLIILNYTRKVPQAKVLTTNTFIELMVIIYFANMFDEKDFSTSIQISFITYLKRVGCQAMLSLWRIA